MYRTLFHACGFAHFVYAVWLGPTHVKGPIDVNVLSKTPRAINAVSDFMGEFKKEQLKYLCVWNMILQAVYYGLCIINDVFGNNEINPKNEPIIRKVKDYVLSSFVFPLTTMIGLIFWGLWPIDRELVFPKVFDLHYPSWYNHMMHTNMLVFLVLEVMTTFRKYPTRASGVKGTLLFMFFYLFIWTHAIFYLSGEWVYPICDVLSWWQRIIFFASICLLASGFYFVGEFFNNQVWAKELKQLEGSMESRKKGI